MNKISLCKPIVLRGSLDDMTASQKKTAEYLLRCRRLLTITQSGIAFIAAHKDTRLPANYFYGSEAVSIYRQSLGLPDVSVRSIDADHILHSIQDFDTCQDILSLLKRIHLRNRRTQKLIGIGAPLIILADEYRVLQESVEELERSIRNRTGTRGAYLWKEAAK